MNVGYFLIPVCFVIGLVYLIYKLKQSNINEPLEAEPNAPIIENNYRKQFTNGYALGHLKTIKLRKNGCYFIEYYPMDIRQGENIKRPPVQDVVCRKEFVKFIPRGLKSGERERIILLPRDPSMLPEEMRDSLEGKWETVEGQKAYLKSTFGKMISSGDEALEESMKDYARGNLAKKKQEELEQQVNQIKKIMSSALKDLTEDKK